MPRPLPPLLALVLLLSGPVPASARDRSLAQPRARAPLTYDDWVFWYHHNADVLEARQAGEERVRAEGDTAGAHARVLATLRDLLDDPERLHPLTVAAACRSLGRASTQAPDVERLRVRLEDPRADPWIREGAAIGLGLLRRGDAGLALPAAVVGEVRLALLRVVEGEGEPPGTRGTAALALGLLGDQAFGEGTASAAEVARRLAALLPRAILDADLAVGLLVALGHQPPDAVGDPTRTALREAVLRGRWPDGSAAPDLLRSYAAWALGALGNEEDVAVLADVLRTRRGMPVNARRSAAIALGALAQRLPAEERERTIGEMVSRLDRERDPTTRNFLRMALVPFLATDARARKATLAAASKGKDGDRSFGVLALALALREGAADWPAAERERAWKVLRADWTRMDAGTCAAFVLALGLARDTSTAADRELRAADPAERPEVRGYALLGLALGDPASCRPGFLRAEAQSPTNHDHRVLALRAVGLSAHAADERTTAFLAETLRRGRTASEKAEAAVALARAATAEVADVLRAITVDASEQDLTRTMAVAGLGRIVDPEPVPSLARLTMGLDYRASTGLIEALFSTL